jgi:hypothetical protein
MPEETRKLRRAVLRKLRMQRKFAAAQGRQVGEKAEALCGMAVATVWRMDGSFGLSTKRRRGLRLSLELPVEFERAGSKVRAYTLNVGLGGAFIKSLERPAYGERIELWIAFPGAASSSLSCVVRWCDDSGFGVQFLQVSAQAAHALTEAMREAAGEALARGPAHQGQSS